MKFHELTKPARQSKRRSGRGIAAGRGKTAGRGTKGQNARSGGGVRPGFEGGQNPVYARIPKLRGFTSHRTPAQEVSTDQLQRLGLKEVSAQTLDAEGLLRNRRSPLRLIKGRSPLEAAVKVTVNAASKQAVSAVESAGGSVEIVPFKPVNKPKKTAKKA